MTDARDAGPTRCSPSAAWTRPDNGGRGRLERVGSYLELHIEQGPVLESEGAALAAVTGCAGIERLHLEFAGQAAHAGTTPMWMRQDAGLAAAETALAVERIATEEGGVGTTGRLDMSPGIVTAVPGGAGLGGRPPPRRRRASCPDARAGPRGRRGGSRASAAATSARSRSGGSSRWHSTRSWSDIAADVAGGQAARPAAPCTTRRRSRGCGPRRCSSSLRSAASATPARRTPRRRTCGPGSTAFGELADARREPATEARR